MIEQGGEFNHGYTYSGHPVACAVAVANICASWPRKASSTGCARAIGPTSPSDGPSSAITRWWARRAACGLMGALELVNDKAPCATFAKEGDHRPDVPRVLLPRAA